MLKQSTLIILWVLVASLILLVLSFTLPGIPRRDFSYLTFAALGLMLVSGSILLFFTIKTNPPGKIKLFFLLTGASAVGVLVFALIHNLAYGLVVHFWGTGFGDEAVFFILAIVICPLGLLAGLIGSFIRIYRDSRSPF
jgi:hypothetical protein